MAESGWPAFISNVSKPRDGAMIVPSIVCVMACRINTNSTHHQNSDRVARPENVA